MPTGHKTPAGTSVLDDLALDKEFITKSKLAIRIQKTVAELGLDRREAADLIGVSQPKLSQIFRGKFEGISQVKLEEGLVALNHRLSTIGDV